MLLNIFLWKVWCIFKNTLIKGKCKNSMYVCMHVCLFKLMSISSLLLNLFSFFTLLVLTPYWAWIFELSITWFGFLSYIYLITDYVLSSLQMWIWICRNKYVTRTCCSYYVQQQCRGKKCFWGYFINQLNHHWTTWLQHICQINLNSLGDFYKKICGLV